MKSWTSVTESEIYTVSNKGKETEKPLCVIDYNHNTGGSRFEGQVAANVHGREEKNDQMVPQTFQKAT